MKKRIKTLKDQYLSARQRDTPSRLSRTLRRPLAPAELFVASFLTLIAAGSLTLMLLPGLYHGESLSWTDSVFTSTSAVCVTGLIVVDTASFFTTAGQAVLLLLIQLGGLGMLVLTSLIISTLGGRPSIRAESVAATSRSVIPYIPARTLIADIVLFTFIIETIRALALYCLWAPKMGWIHAIWPAIFHSISAFCNAGFSTYSDSLIGFQDSPETLAVISILVICGGLGFVTMEEVYRLHSHRKKFKKRLSVHSKLVFATTGFLLIVPWGLFALFEWNAALVDMPVIDKLSNSFFMSVTPRTAGFNSIDYGRATDSSNFLTIILMMIGGSPGSTAGGMKTTTFALLGLLAWSRLRSSPTVTFADRSIPEETIQRATGLFVITTGVVVIGVFILASLGDLVGNHPSFIAEVFEVVSAFNTVGLSMGITAELSLPCRWLMIALMFAGRTGPLAIAAALIVYLPSSGRFRLAYEDVVVG